MTARIALVVVLIATSSDVLGYEWLSHNSMALYARVLANKAEDDPALQAFLKSYGARFLDTRAGDLNENDYTDEDHNEGYLRGPTDTCGYREEACWQLGSVFGKKIGALTCTFDHFSPKLALPLGQEEASRHARYYLDMAVKLYKSAKCDSRGKAGFYYEGAARALGHVIHLVEDMGSPSHTVPENHLDYPLGHGKSFHEFWALDVWGNGHQRRYTKPDGSGFKYVGGFELAAAGALKPRNGQLEGIMGALAAESRRFLDGSPYNPGSAGSFLLLTELRRVFADSELQQGPQEIHDKDGTPTGWRMPAFLVKSFPIYGRGLRNDGLHGYGTFLVLAEPDYEEVGNTLPLERGGIAVKSFELGERMWAQVDQQDPEKPIQFDNKFHTLITHTTEAAAGAILAFWDEAKDYQCPCYGFTPCAFRAGSKNPECGAPKPAPYPPGGDYPDDTPGIVSNVSSGESASLAQFDSVELGEHWKQIAAVGVEKGLPSLVDFGRTMWLLGMAQDEALTETSTEQLARGMADMERKYSVHRPRPEDDMAKAAHVGVLENGFAGEAASALDALGWTHATVPIGFDPLQLAESQKILLVPSGGLYGTSGSPELRERLGAFVEAGGTLIVMAQMLGEDFQTVPVPAGESLKGFGWFEDQSCWGGSVRIASAHPITAALGRSALSVAIDGYLEQWPSGATVLLRKTHGGMPVLLAYPLGSGWVVAGTLFDDWGRANGRSSAEGQALLASLVRWGLDPGKERPACAFASGCTVTVSVNVRNLTELPADTIAWRLYDSSGTAIAQWSEKREVGSGEQGPREVEVTLPAGPGPSWLPWRPGIVTLTYQLEDSTRALDVLPMSGSKRPWVIQTEASAAQLVAEDWSADVVGAPQVGLGLAVDSEYVLDGSSIPIHLSVRNFGAEPFSGVVKLSTWARRFPDVPVDAAPGALSTYDLRAGPVHLTTGHDGLQGGGAITAELYSANGEGPLATAVKNLLNDPKLFAFSVQASEPTAGAGDDLHFLGTLTNRSLGDVDVRHRMTFANYYSTTGVRCPETKTDWSGLHLGQDESTSIDQPYTVPSGCNGIIEAVLHLCYPGQRCWDDGNEGSASHRSVQVVLPNANVELGFGEFTVVEGPAFRLPVTVRNVGMRDVRQGQLRLWVHLSAVEVESPTFDLARGAETTISLDFPMPPLNPFQSYYTVGAAFRDLSVKNWSFHTTHDLHYGGGITSIDGFHAAAGSESIAGTVQIENRSSATRRFALTFDQPDLDFHDTRELDIGPFQKAAIALSVPLPSPQTYGVWPLHVAASDGALLNLQRVINLIHDRPFVQIGVRPDAAAYRAGAKANLSVEVSPGRLARPLAGTLELACDQLEVLETRPLTLASLQTAIEAFSLTLPPAAHAGAIAYRVRFSGSDGTVVESEGSVSVPPARFEVRPLHPAVLTAGDTIAYEVRNVGGSPAGSFAFEWQLRGERGWLARSARTVPAPLDEAQQITFNVPSDLVSGSYWVTLEYPSTDERSLLSEKLEIAGVEASLDVGTGWLVYPYGQAINGWARITAGPRPLPNANLTLKVLAPKLCTERVVPWGVFQGSDSRQGYAPVIGAVFPPGSVVPCFGPTASLPAGVSPVAVAAGDVNEDLTDDLVVVWRGTDGASLGVFLGPDLTQVSSSPLAGNPAAFALAVADADGDGHLEIFEADTGDGSSMVFRAYDRALRLRWETGIEAAINPGSAFPGGGPVLADLEGSGKSTLLVSSGRDMLALDASSGAPRWRMVEANPSFEGRFVTGIAVADIDGDGHPEVAVGFRVPGTPASGAIALVESTGAVRWAQSTASPVAGSPVFLPSGRVAAIQTPESSTMSSTLMLLDAVTGRIVGQSVSSFWSPFTPASADTNGDGSPEVAVVSGDPACATCAPRAVLMFTQQGALLWSVAMSGPSTAPPVLVDMDGDATPDVVADYLTRQNKDGVTCLRGVDGARIAGEDSLRSPNTHPLHVLDINGDCLPEILTGQDVLKGMSCAGPGRIVSKLSAQAQGEVVWRWESSSNLEPSQLWEVPKQLSTNQRTGFFYLVGDVKNSLGQIIAHDESTFSVQWGTVLLSLDPFPQACRAASELQARGTIHNAGAASRTVDLVFLLDKAEIGRRQLSLAPGESQPFSEMIGSGAAGGHTLTVNVMAGTSWLQGVTQQFRVEEPAVKVSVPDGLKVGQTEFELKVELTNLSHLALELDVGLDLPEQPPTGREHVTLAAESKSTVVFHRQISADTSFVARVSGDANAETVFEADYDVDLTPTYVGGAGVPEGVGLLRIELGNAGGHPWSGDLRWSLTGASSLNGAIAGHVDPHSTQAFDVPVNLTPGASLLRLEAGGVVREFPLMASAGGCGSLSVAVGDKIVESEVAPSLRITNLLQEPGTFVVDLVLRDADSGETVKTEHLVWTLAGNQYTEEAIPLDLPPGPYLLTPHLNGIEVTSEVRFFEVLPRYAAEMTAILAPVPGDGTLPLVVTVHNTGARDISGTLTLSGLGDVVVTPDFEAAAGETHQVTIPIDPDLLTTGDVPIDVSYATGTGQVLADQRLVIPVLPATPLVASAPRSVAATAGTTAPADFVLANMGTQTASYELALFVNGGSVFANRQQGRLPGGQQEMVRFDVSIPPDMPSGRLEGVYTLVRIDQGSEQGSTVATGRFPLSVEGTPVIVTAEVERDHVGPGESVVLTLTLKADNLDSPLPLFALVSYPPFGERRDFELGSTGSQLRFEVPIGQPGSELGYGVYFPSGRALHLDSVTIRAAGGPVEISASQREYRPGDQVQFIVTLNKPGLFEGYGFEQSVSLSASGGASFQIPFGVPQGRYPILWTFYGSGSDGGIINGEFPVKVRGPLVRITRLRVSKPADLSGPEESVQVAVTADMPLSALLRAWVVGSSDRGELIGESPLELEPGAFSESELRFDLSGAEGGAQSCVVGVYGQDGTLLAEGAAHLELSGARILAVRTDRASYPGTADPVTALVDVQGSGQGSLALRLDGRVAMERSVTLAGMQRIAVFVPGTVAGPHQLEAVLEADGRSSSGSTSFSVGMGLADLAVDMGGSQTDSGTISVAATVRNLGQTDAPNTDLVLWDGNPDSGRQVSVLAIPALVPAGEAFVSTEIVLAEGQHTVTGWADPSAHIEEFDRSNNIASFTITVGPGVQPPPRAVSTVQVASRSYRLGDPILVEGQAADGSYCAAVVANGVWSVDDPAPLGILASATLLSSGGVIPQTQVWIASALGSYDVLLLSGACGTGGTIVAASDPGAASGFDVLADAIPVLSGSGLLALVGLIAVIGLWFLATRRA